MYGVCCEHCVREGMRCYLLVRFLEPPLLLELAFRIFVFLLSLP
jgi:hypothetical protein